MKSITRIAITALALVTLALAATAQTGITPSFTSTADAVHYRGSWTPGTTESFMYDVKDSPADASGNVDSFYLGALARSYGTAGFSTYGGYGQYEPTKFVAKYIGKTNIPADSFRVYVRGGVGNTVPAVGKAFFTGFVGAGASMALNSSGSVVWDAFYGEWQNPGVFIVKSGAQIYWGGNSTGNTQSKAAKLRRALKR